MIPSSSPETKGKSSISWPIPAVLSPEVAAAGGVVAAGVAPCVAAHAERDAQPPLHVLVERPPPAKPVFGLERDLTVVIIEPLSHL